MTSINGPEHHTNSVELVPEKRVYFGRPDPRIGTLLAKHSTLKPGERDLPVEKQVLYISLAFVPALLFLLLGLILGWNRDLTLGMSLCIGVAGIVGAVFIWKKVRFYKVCYYIGEDGGCNYAIKSLKEKPTSNVLLFKNAVELRSGSTQHFYNGTYVHTEYFFDWIGSDGKKVFELKGTYKGLHELPDVEDPYHFGHLLEKQWNAYLLQRLNQDFERQGYIDFSVKGSDSVRIGSGYLEFRFGSRHDRMNIEDIKSFTIDLGIFTVIHQDSNWLGKGVYAFSYQEIANASVFCMYLKEKTGLEITSQ